MDDGANLTYFASDHLSSTSIAFDASGTLLSEQRYKPFGELRTDVGLLLSAGDTGFTDFGYTGQRDLGDIGLMDYNARFYSPTLGRFIQPDSIVPNPGNPQSWNRYGYVHNNPIKFTDPSGHISVDSTESMKCYNPNDPKYCEMQRIDSKLRLARSSENLRIKRLESLGAGVPPLTDRTHNEYQNLRDSFLDQAIEMGAQYAGIDISNIASFEFTAGLTDVLGTINLDREVAMGPASISSASTLMTFLLHESFHADRIVAGEYFDPSDPEGYAINEVLALNWELVNADRTDITEAQRGEINGLITFLSGDISQPNQEIMISVIVDMNEGVYNYTKFENVTFPND